MAPLNRVGRKPAPVGTRVRDQHTVAVKLPTEEWEKLQQISQILEVREGRFASNHLIDFIRSIDLAALERESTQEALPMAQAS